MKYALEQKGLNETGLARLTGHSQQAINFIASGKTTNPRNLAKIAAALEVSEAWLRYGSENGAPSGSQSTLIKGGSFPDRRTSLSSAAEANQGFAMSADTNDLPVYGVPAGMDGIDLDMSDPVAFTGRPPMLYGNKRGFAVYMNGESMSPRFDHGEMLWIDPVQPPQIGDYVLSVTQDGFAIPRQLVAVDSEKITLLARNEERESTEQRDRIRHIYKIVGSRAL
ncbi:MAG: hypothetical protein AXW12_00570 [Thalassospira sp. Nap_22]|nr:MAG: hypothetical protein AXW12_00570 [Thalassospira sp. Nap_22]